MQPFTTAVIPPSAPRPAVLHVLSVTEFGAFSHWWAELAAVEMAKVGIAIKSGVCCVKVGKVGFAIIIIN